MKKIYSWILFLSLALTGIVLASCESDAYDDIRNMDPPTPVSVEGETASLQGRIYQYGYKDPEYDWLIYVYTISFSGGVANYQEAAGDTEMAEWSSTNAAGYYKRNGNTVTIDWSWTDYIDQSFFKYRSKKMYVDDEQRTLQFEGNTYERIK